MCLPYRWTFRSVISVVKMVKCRFCCISVDCMKGFLIQVTDTIIIGFFVLVFHEMLQCIKGMKTRDRVALASQDRYKKR